MIFRINSIGHTIFIVENSSVLFEIRTEFLNVFCMSFVFGGKETSCFESKADSCEVFAVMLLYSAGSTHISQELYSIGLTHVSQELYPTGSTHISQKLFYWSDARISRAVSYWIDAHIS
jgi:hypothetical protein